MEITRTEFKSNNTIFPSINIKVENSKAEVIIIHGFGGNKEEQLGLGFRVSELGFNTYTIDLQGHGQNEQPLDSDLLDNLNSVIKQLKNKYKVVAIGHSLGGRISLLSDADIRIGISPALKKNYSEKTVGMINMMRQYRVKELEPGYNFQLLNELPDVDKTMTPQDLILYGTRDVPEIIEECKALADKELNVFLIPNAFHNDIYLLEDTIKEVEKHLLTCFKS